jgi:DNA processing protein
MLRHMSARIPLNEVPRRLVTGSPQWPHGLNGLREPPAQLYALGELPPLDHAIAIVGTRYASDDACRFARELARELAAAGAVIVSGGAAGIDGEAHRGALEAGGRTVAILATGLRDAYPAQHASLFAQIARSGVLLCESEGKPPGAGGYLFLRRNRLIAALARAVVVVQAPYKSGALSTAHEAKILKRQVFAVPAAPWDIRGTGCLELLRTGTEICSSARDILSVAGLGSRGRSGQARRPINKNNEIKGLAAQVRSVWRQVQLGAVHPDQISATLDMPAAEVQEALLTLLLRGLCRQRADGTYMVASGR